MSTYYKGTMMKILEKSESTVTEKGYFEVQKERWTIPDIFLLENIEILGGPGTAMQDGPSAS